MRLETIRALKYRNFRLFWVGSWFSYSGQAIQVMAVTWLVLELTGSPLYLGLIGLVRAVPALVFSLLGGVLADRLNRRWLFLLTHIGTLSMSLLLAFLVTLGLANVWVVLGVTFLWTSAFAINTTTRQAFIPELVDRPDLLNAISLNATVFSAGRIIGPILAGIIIVHWNIAASFYLTAILMVPLVLVLPFIRVPSLSHPANSGNIVKDFGEGLGYVKENRSVAWLLFLVALPTFFGMSYTVLLPIFASNLGVGATGYGWLISISSVGGVLASLGVANLGKFSHKGWLVLWIAITFGLLLIALSFSRWYPLSLVLVLLVGAANNGYLTLANSLIQLIVPDELRGRVMSLYSLNPAVLHHLGTLSLGALATAIGATFSLMTGGLIVSVFVAAMAIWIPRLRRL